MPEELPPKAVKYAETKVFTTETVPAKLTNEHDTKPGVWGKLKVLTGALDYIVCGPPEKVQHLRAGQHTIVLPTQMHRVSLEEKSSFYVEFYHIPK